MKKGRTIQFLNRLHTAIAGLLVWGGMVFTGQAGQLVTQEGASLAAPAGAGGNCGMPMVTPDGRYVVFASTANNLALTGGGTPILTRTLGNLNVYLRDRTNQTTTLVSVNLAGTGGGNGDSIPRGVSTNGQYVLFDSAASNLIPNIVTSRGDVFVRDVVHGVTTLVSVATNGAPGNFISSNSVMTPDGRYVAFSSMATNLVLGDTNEIPDIFVRDLVAGKTTLVSVGVVATNYTMFVNAGSFTITDSPQMTPDGRYVVFFTTGSNTATGVQTTGELYVRDLVGGTTIWASSGARGPWFPTGTPVVSCNYQISDDGRYVAYEACGNNGVTNSSSATVPSTGAILRYGLLTGLTDLVATNANIPAGLFQYIHNLDMSPDGRFITFVSNGLTSYVTNTTVYLWDAQSGTSTLVSVNTNGAPSAGPIFDSPAVSSSGQFVTFLSNASDLTANPVSSEYDLYVRDIMGGTTTLVDANANGSGAGVNATTVPVMSANGSVIVFDSRDMLSDNRNRFSDIFAFHRAAETFELISAHQPSQPSLTPDGISGLGTFSVSTNGQYVAFYSDADNLASGGVSNGLRNVYVRNLAMGANTLVSVATNGLAGDGISTEPAISGSGRYVAFTSSADNLIAGDTNNALDVFVRDLQLQTTTLASLGSNGVDPGNGDSYAPVMSADGRYVLFRSKASNLAAFSFGGTENLIWRDLQAGTNYTIATGTGSYGYAVTPDLHYVAFVGTPTRNVTGLFVWNSQSNVFIYTNTAAFPGSVLPLETLALSANGTELAYQANSPFGLYVVNLASNTVSTVINSGLISSHASFQFSADGHYLAYSYAPGPPPNPPVQNVYVYDCQARTSLQINQSFNGQAITNPPAAITTSDSPAISPDGRFIAYRSQARIIVPNDFVPAANVFMYDRVNNATIVASLDLGGNSTAGDDSLKAAFSADGSTLAFESWAPDLVTNDFNGGSDLFTLSMATLPVVIAGGSGGGSSNAPPLYAQVLPPGAVSANTAVSWPLATGAAYEVQFKTNLNDAVWQVLTGPPAYIGDTGYINDPSPAAQKFYRIVQTAP
jgi:Tol biopolymer transport system component